MAVTDLHHTHTIPRPLPSIARIARRLYTAMAWLFVAGVIVQVFLAGLGLMVDGGRLADHRALGYLVLHIPYVLLIVGLFARLPGRLLAASVLLALLATAHDVFVYIPVEGDAGFLRALHPVNALLLFWLGASIARGALRLPHRFPRASESPEVKA